MSWEDRELKRNYKDEPVPQHWGGNDWEVTGVDNPLPVANYTQNNSGIWLPTNKDNPMPMEDAKVENKLNEIEQKLDSVIENNAVNTQLTGSIVEEISNVEGRVAVGNYYFGSVYSRDETESLLDISKYRKKAILVENTGEDIVRVYGFLFDRSDGSRVITNTNKGDHWIIDPGSRMLFTNNEVPELDLPLTHMTIVMRNPSEESYATVTYFGGT